MSPHRLRRRKGLTQHQGLLHQSEHIAVEKDLDEADHELPVQPGRLLCRGPHRQQRGQTVSAR